MRAVASAACNRTALGKSLRHHHRPSKDMDARDRPGRAGRSPRPLRLRQDHHPAHDRRLHRRPPPATSCLDGQQHPRPSRPTSATSASSFNHTPSSPTSPSRRNIAFGLEMRGLRAPAPSTSRVADMLRLTRLEPLAARLPPRALRRPAAARRPRPAPWPSSRRLLIARRTALQPRCGPPRRSRPRHPPACSSPPASPPSWSPTTRTRPWRWPTASSS